MADQDTTRNVVTAEDADVDARHECEKMEGVHTAEDTAVHHTSSPLALVGCRMMPVQLETAGLWVPGSSLGGSLSMPPSKLVKL